MKKNKTLEFIKDFWILLLIVGVPVLGFTASMIFKEPISKTLKRVHWHAPISYDLCGNTQQLKDDAQHGNMHGHNDKKIHIEGVVDTEKRIESLGGFFDLAKIPFSQTQIGKYKNGDTCPGSNTPGKVSVRINGKINNEFRDYILNDKDEIKIIFK